MTHHFRNKDELILFALNQVTERLQTAMEIARKSTEGVDRLVAMLSAFLPLDTERKNILKVWLAFLGYAVGRESLMREHQRSAAQLHGAIVQELQDLDSAKLIRENLDLNLEANVLLALANGVSLDSLIQGKALSSPQQELVIRRHIHEFLSRDR